ncbi:hypothetical protein, partial [Escherichia coli]|uniref:hypothetical protein n=1 Tax=Escherichia coli TaxID=562 RepID=UPI001BB081EE
VLMVYWLRFSALTTAAWFVSQSGNHTTHLLVVILWQLHIAVMLKAEPLIFQTPTGSPVVDRFQWSFQTK